MVRCRNFQFGSGQPPQGGRHVRWPNPPSRAVAKLYSIDRIVTHDPKGHLVTPTVATWAKNANCTQPFASTASEPRGSSAATQPGRVPRPISDQIFMTPLCRMPNADDAGTRLERHPCGAPQCPAEGAGRSFGNLDAKSLWYRTGWPCNWHQIVMMMPASPSCSAEHAIEETDAHVGGDACADRPQPMMSSSLPPARPAGVSFTVARCCAGKCRNCGVHGPWPARG